MPRSRPILLRSAAGRRVATMLAAICLMPSAMAAAFDLAAAVKAADRGQQIRVPAGTHAVGGVVLPAGITLVGAGPGKTVLDAATAGEAIVVEGDGVTIGDLSIRGARQSGVLVRGAAQVTLARIEIRDCLTGILADGAADLRIENSVVSGNRTGIALSRSRRSIVVNCTLIDNRVLALSLAGGERPVVFNNIFTGSPTAVSISRGLPDVHLDANLYSANAIGVMGGEVPRTTIFGWRRLTGFDRRSVNAAVTFQDAAGGDYRPTSRKFWNPTLATTSECGLGELAGVRAPEKDRDGKPRMGRFDVGAHEASFDNTGAPAGMFTVASDDTLTSAALYHRDGRMLVELFQNMPLPAGTHPFFVPARDQFNQPIPAGDYELRLVESSLHNPYRGLAGSFGRSASLADSCSWPEEVIGFDGQNRVYVLQNSFENGQGVRAFDAAYENPRWMMPGGGGTVGWATDDRWLYYLQKRPGGKFLLRKIDLETGSMGDVRPGAGSAELSAPFTEGLRGMALVAGSLYLSDPGVGAIFKASAADPVFSEFAKLPGAVSLCADSQSQRLWALSATGELVAIDAASGRVEHRSKPVPGATSISANAGRLAVLSPETGKVHVFDCSDPAGLKALHTIGTGDGPGGPQRPDRFWFQQGTAIPISGSRKASVSINAAGDVAVVDGPRVTFWSAAGTLRRQGLGFWGQHLYAGRFAPDEDVRLFGISGDYSILMDSRTGTWKPDGAGQLPQYVFPGRAPRHYFAADGKRFAVFEVSLGDPAKTGAADVTIAGFDPAKQRLGGTHYLVMRMDERTFVPVTLAYNHPVRKTLVECHDVDGNGIIDGEEGLLEIRKADGQPVLIPGTRYGGLPWLEDGSIVFTSPSPEAPHSSTAQVVRMTGLEQRGGWPIFDWAAMTPVPCLGGEGQTCEIVSPYDFKTKERLASTVQVGRLADGGYASAVMLKSSGGTGLANGAGTDIAGFGPDGRFRWLFKLAAVEGCEGVQTLPTLGLCLGMTSKECDYMVVDAAGLGLGALSMPRESHWHGMWSDHAQQQVAWIGNDGRPNYVLGDYAANGYHWFSIDNVDSIRRSRQAVSVSAGLADQLAQLPDGEPPLKRVAPPSTTVKIPQLSRPLPIDGELGKWRQAGVPLAAIVTPESGSAGLAGPADCSGVIRLAWEGKDLYVQTIVFDDVVTKHQPVVNMYQQDGIEMAINGFMEGFKFNVAMTTDKGPTVFRNRFVVKGMDRIYSEAEVPRNIRFLSDSREIEERKFIESLTGVDLAASPAIVTEFRLPLTADVALSGDPRQIEKVGVGAEFYVGFMINDNDVKGGDIQEHMVWPSTYGTFNLKTAGAKAVLQ
jgi:parallel beta-helix repeat protein